MRKLLLILLLLALPSLGRGGERPRIRPRAESLPEPPTRVAAVSGDFALRDGEVIGLLGGTRTAKLDDRAYLELLLTLAADEKRVYFRNMGWQADTVYRQDRPLDFGSLSVQLARADVTVVIAAFGQMEALDGGDRIPEFLAAYERLLDEAARRTERIVLVTPTPFGKPPVATLPDLTRHNAAIAAYAVAIRDLAAKRGFPCVDVSEFPVGGDTTDGIQLTPLGEWRYAVELATRLTGASPLSAGEVDAKGCLTDRALETWRKRIVEKNRFWREYWRPTNWAFAYGDRKDQPSSRDHRPGMPRWFPAEIDGIVPLIETAEDAILEQRKALGR